MNPFRCPLCDSGGYEVQRVYRGKASCFLNKVIVRCHDCDGLSMTPLPSDDELDNYYRGYWSMHDVEAEMTLLGAQAEARYEFLKSDFPISPELNVLDVGAGFGLIQNVMASKLSERHLCYDAVEIDPMALNYLRGDRRFARPRDIFASIKESKGPYQMMILSHILEHMKSPALFLEDQLNRVTKDGILFIEVPNQDHLYKPLNEPHLIFFNPETLSKTVQRSGYQILKIDTCGLWLKDLIRLGRFGRLKNLVREIFPSPLLNLIRKSRKGGPFDALTRHVSQYGPDRQWIRLVARKAA
jgi:SAM-dependent methyltransferase